MVATNAKRLVIASLAASSAALPAGQLARVSYLQNNEHAGGSFWNMFMATPSISSPDPTAPITASISSASINPSVSTSPTTVPYTHYTGNGSTLAGWPPQSSWLSFPTLWTLNKAAFIDKADSASQKSNTPQDTQNLHDTILQVATHSNIDPRFILAIIIQESHGNVYVRTTTFPGGSNPGLMQTHNGIGTCENLETCPESMIRTMVEEGTETGSDGENLKDLIDGCSDVGEEDEDVSRRYYVAARKYNSGKESIGTDGDLSAPGATASYVSDVANRLVGYVGGQDGGE